jgi:hypothetical protein
MGAVICSLAHLGMSRLHPLKLAHHFYIYNLLDVLNACVLFNQHKHDFKNNFACRSRISLPLQVVMQPGVAIVKEGYVEAVSLLCAAGIYILLEWVKTGNTERRLSIVLRFVVLG